jgi:hypothetical protein
MGGQHGTLLFLVGEFMTYLFKRRMVLSTFFRPASASSLPSSVGDTLGAASAILSAMALTSDAIGFSVFSSDIVKISGCLVGDMQEGLGVWVERRQGAWRWQG